jgi:hypothetical protein
LGGIFAATGWCLGLVMTKHPLLVQMHLAIGAFAKPRFPFFQRGHPSGREVAVNKSKD